MYDITQIILDILKKYTKDDICDFDWHYNIINSFIKSHQPIKAILPAFPGKAINPNLCPSNMPDGAEKYAVDILKKITTEIHKVYKPGIELNIFHDGYYFIPLAMDYEYYKMQEYVDVIKKMFTGFSVKSIDMKDTTEGTTFDARLNYWEINNYPTDMEFEKYKNSHKEIYDGIAAFFFYNYSSYLYPLESNHFRKKISRYIANKYLKINLSVQMYIEKKYSNYLRLSVKQQNNEKSKKFYIDILNDIKNEGLPWMNTLVLEDGVPVIRKFRKE